MAAVLDEERLRRVLGRMLDQNEFLSPFGVRGLSRLSARSLLATLTFMATGLLTVLIVRHILPGAD